jgi:hypothetical protein
MISEVNDGAGSFSQSSDFIVVIQDQISESNNNKIHMV